MKKITSMLWGNEVEIRMACENLFLIRFESKDACDLILDNGPWHFQNNYIASVVGHTLYMDIVTAIKSHLAFGKVCVEVDVDRILPRTVPKKMVLSSSKDEGFVEKVFTKDANPVAMEVVAKDASTSQVSREVLIEVPLVSQGVVGKILEQPSR
ncbi:hypothetical protein V6N13_110791 [Hibiscus sabdariffa]